VSYRIAQDSSYQADGYWTWSAWIEAEEGLLDRITEVTWVLHPSFRQTRIVSTERASAFRLDSAGWDTFLLRAEISVDSTGSLTLEHDLVLTEPGQASGATSSADRGAERSDAPAEAVYPPLMVFLSFGGADARVAGSLRRSLEETGLRCTYATAVETGCSKSVSVERLITRCNAVVAVVGDDEVSPFVLGELELALVASKPAIALVAEGASPAGLHTGVDQLRFSASGYQVEPHVVNSLVGWVRAISREVRSHSSIRPSRSVAAAEATADASSSAASIGPMNASAASRDILERIEQSASTDATVLPIGESSAKSGHDRDTSTENRPKRPLEPLHATIWPIPDSRPSRDIPPVVRLDGVKKVFYKDETETTALAGIDLEIPRGEYLAISGPAGSGKSTILSILGMLDVPSEGRYWLNGRPVESLSLFERSRLRHREIGFLFQNFNLISELTVIENVELPLTYRGIRAAERRQRCNAALERVGMAHRAKHLPIQLSGGQLQRVALARAIVGEPHILLADEPTGNLDAKNGEMFMELLLEVHRDGLAICMLTHDPQPATYADRSLHLVAGRIVEPLEVHALH
jgi:putative ABC transport system ATP-binding protein